MSKEKLYIVSLSGGKDSTAMLLRLIEEKRPIDRILFCDTGLEFPQMYDHLNKLEQYIGRKITRLKAEYSFEDYWNICRNEKIPRCGSTRETVGQDRIIGGAQDD